jgi:hypothetical protein
MTQLESSVPDHGGQEVGLPAVVEELLVDVVADGFALFCCGPNAAPRALVASYKWPDWVDLLTVRDFDRVITARAPEQGGRVDIFDPGIVAWAYEGPPQHAVRALLQLVHPEHPEARRVAGSSDCATPNDDPTANPEPGRSAHSPSGHRDTYPWWGSRGEGRRSGRERKEIAGWLSVERAAPDAQLPAASWPPANTGEEGNMLTRSSPAVQTPWRDIDGKQIVLFCRVEQVDEDTEPTMLPSRLHQRGQVVGRGLDSLYVSFPGNQVISLTPELVRVLDDVADGE